MKDGNDGYDAYMPQENSILKNEFTAEGIRRASQHNFNQAEAGYNAKWFKRGALFGYKKANEENIDNSIIGFYHFINENYTEIKGLFDLKETPYWAFDGKTINELLLIYKTKCSNLT